MGAVAGERSSGRTASRQGGPRPPHCRPIPLRRFRVAAVPAHWRLRRTAGSPARVPALAPEYRSSLTAVAGYRPQTAQRSWHRHVLTLREYYALYLSTPTSARTFLGR